MSYLRIGLPLAFGSFAAAMLAAHLYYTSSESIWPLLLIGVAVMVLGFAWNARGSQPAYPEYASQGHVVLSAGVVVLIIATLLWLPSTIRVAQEPDFSSLAAMDAKIDRFLKTQRVDSSVLAAATLGGFEQGSAVLDCDGEVTHAALASLLDAVEVAHNRGQRPILLLIGMTDRMPLKPALRKQYESNVGLAAARTDAVRACLDVARADAPQLTAAMQTLRLTTGPAYSPQIPDLAFAEMAKMALDRQVSALLFSLPVTATESPSRSSSQPHSSASDKRPPERQWLRCMLLILGVCGLIGLTVTIFWKIPKRAAPVVQATPKAGPPDCQNAAEALGHVREMHQMFAELRTRNFNFFIVIVAAVIAAAATLKESDNLLMPFVAALAVALTCVIFFGIEKRTVEMIGDARLELERLEEPLGVNLNRRDKWVNATGVRRRTITHTTLYDWAFKIVYGGALVAICLYNPW